MVDPDEFLVLDTGILLHLLRGDASAHRIETDYNLMTRDPTPFVSIITVGEIFALARRNRYGQVKTAKLEERIRRLVVIGIERPIADRYAIIQASQQAIGRPIGENDTWIAATAATSGAVLLTTDRDFARLAPELVKVEIIQESSQP